MEHFTSAERDQLAKERKRIIKKQLEDAQVVDPTVKVRFLNVEDPPVPGRPSPPLSFAFGRYVFKESRSEDDGQDTALRHGNEYLLPVSVVNHLNSLKVPVKENIIDPVTKALKTIVTGHSNRFSCVPVDMGSFTQVDVPAQVQLKRGPGRPSTKQADASA